MNCINLCDILTIKDFQDKNFEKLLLNLSGKRFERLFIGSYFCSQYFLNMGFLSYLKHYLNDHFYRLTLVIPIISEKDLVAVKRKIDYMLFELPIDEITVNDVGMLSALKSNHDVRLNLGRLFFKDERDIRLQSLCKHMLHPAEFDRLKEYEHRYSIKYAELDPTRSYLDLSNNTEIKFAIHMPLCYMTTGNICKYASINKRVTEKFRPNTVCSNECQEVYEIYTPEKQEYALYRIGRTIYFVSDLPKAINGQFSRLIYFPFFEMKQLCGSDHL